MATTESLIAKLEAEKDRLIPTPPVGWPIVWHRAADPDYTVPATVAKTQGPGKIVINIDIPHQMRMTKDGCLHSTHPQHDQRHNATSVNCGSWDYVEGMDIPDSHYDFHRANLERRLAEQSRHLAPKKELDVEDVKARLKAVDKKPTRKKAGAEKEAV